MDRSMIKRWIPFAALLLPLQALAQSGACPELPPASGLAWEVSEGGDFLYCRAVHQADGAQAFSVMLREESPMRERMSLREERGAIDGHEIRWYRGDVATTNAIVRETAIELDDDLVAHIVLRAVSEEQLAESRRLAEGLRFADTRLGSH
ncbi:hypothetical protein [uncultured Luteimonas sp.]|uniref:hypothetical protein n=1 Tax=uncultured Luteimonas sp. TaxID=453144 RepID=UPI0026268D3E|nr:hypothetical protein [uncultured Luteimonas sp.]